MFSWCCVAGTEMGLDRSADLPQSSQHHVRVYVPGLDNVCLVVMPTVPLQDLARAVHVLFSQQLCVALPEALEAAMQAAADHACQAAAAACGALLPADVPPAAATTAAAMVTASCKASCAQRLLHEVSTNPCSSSCLSPQRLSSVQPLLGPLHHSKLTAVVCLLV